MWVVRATSRGICILTTAPLEYTNTKTTKVRYFKFAVSSSGGSSRFDEVRKRLSHKTPEARGGLPQVVPHGALCPIKSGSVAGGRRPLLPASLKARARIDFLITRKQGAKRAELPPLSLVTGLKVQELLIKHADC